MTATMRVRQPLEKLDLGYVNAKPIVTRAWTRVRIVLVGCGGTGSWLAPSLARLCVIISDSGKSVELTFIDPDHVEQKNIPRQNFCNAELGQNKAAALAVRYGIAWGIDIRSIRAPFAAGHFLANYNPDELRVVVGCVDNAAARSHIAGLIQQHNLGNSKTGNSPQTWWLDCGNSNESGQVLLGTAPAVEELQDAFTPPSICLRLPSPALQRPELLEALPEEMTDNNLSCAEIAMRNAQSLMVNQTVAAVAADYLLRLLVAGDLRRFATYMDLAAGVHRSSYTVPEVVAASIGKTVDIFDVQPVKKAK